MVTLLRPHQAVKCPRSGNPVLVSECEVCEHVLEVRRPWRGFAVKCELDGESDNRTVEYG